MILAAQGLTDKQIAAQLGISPETVSTYWRRIRTKYGASSRTEVVATAMQERADQELRALTDKNQELLYETAQRRRAERALRERIELDDALSSAAAWLMAMSGQKTEDALGHALGIVATAIHADAAYFTGICEKTGRWKYMASWLRPGLEFSPPSASDLQAESLKWFKAAVERLEPILVRGPAEIPSEGATEAALLSTTPFAAIAMAPSRFDAHTRGWCTYLWREEIQEWPADLADLLGIASDLLAGARQRQEMERALAWRLNLDEAVAEITALLLRSPADRIDDALAATLSRLGPILHARQGGIHEFDESRSAIRSRAQWRLAQASKNSDADWFALEEHRPAFERLCQGKCLVIDSTHTALGALDRSAGQLGALGIEVAVLAPIMSDGRVLACLSFGGDRDDLARSPGVLHVLSVVAECLAGALVRERRHQRLQRSVAIEKALVGLSSRLVRSSASDLANDVAQSLGEIGEALSSPLAMCWEAGPEAGDFQLMAKHRADSPSLPTCPDGGTPAQSAPWRPLIRDATGPIGGPLPAGDPYYEAMSEAGITHWVATPCRLAGQLLAVITLGLPAELSGDPATASMLQVFADVVAGAIGRRRVVDELRRNAAVEAILARTSAHLLDAPDDDLGPAIERALGELSDRLGAQAAAIYALRPDPARLERTHTWQEAGSALDWSEEEDHPASDIARWVERAEAARRTATGGHAGSCPGPAYAGHETIAIPLWRAGAVRGWLVLTRPAHCGGWDQKDRSTASLASDAFASALERQRLMSEIIARRTLETTLRNLAAALASAGPSEVETCMRSALQGVASQVGAEEASVFLIDEAHEGAQCVARWHEPDLPADLPRMQWIPLKPRQWLVERLTAGRILCTQDLSALPDEAADYRALLEATRVRAICLAPLRAEGQLLGWLGCINRVRQGNWRANSSALLAIAGDILAQAVHRARWHRSFRERHELDAEVGRLIARLGRAPDADLPAEVSRLLAATGPLIGATGAWFARAADGDRKVRIESAWQLTDAGAAERTEGAEFPLDLVPYWRKILLEGRCFECEDVRDLPEEAAAERALLDADGVRAFLVAPISVRGAFAGWISFSRDDLPGRWPPGAAMATHVIAECVAGVLARETSSSEVRHIGEGREALLEAGRKLARGGSVADVVRTLDKAIRRVVAFDAIGLYQYEAREGLMRPIAVDGYDWTSGALQDWTLPADCSIVGRVARTGEGGVFNDAHLNPLSAYPEGALVQREHILTLPILDEERRVLAVLIIDRVNDPRPFVRHEYELVEMLSSFVGLALLQASALRAAHAS